MLNQKSRVYLSYLKLIIHLLSSLASVGISNMHYLNHEMLQNKTELLTRALIQ